MDYKSDQHNREVADPCQNPRPGTSLVEAQYCLQKPAKYTLEREVFSNWSIKNANGPELFHVRDKSGGWSYPAQRELMNMNGDTIMFMEKEGKGDGWRAFVPTYLGQRRIWEMRVLERVLHIFLPSNTNKKSPDYIINDLRNFEMCTIYHGQQHVPIAHVKRGRVKTTWKNIFFGKKRIFHVLVLPGVDTAFIFSLLAAMDPSTTT